MGDTERGAGGRFQASVSDEELLAAVRAHEPAGTSEVAEEVGVTRQGADRRLRSLRDEGRVNSKKIAKSLVWFDADAADVVADGGSAAPLRRLVGALDADAAADARGRSDAWRQSVDEEIAPDGA